jgi:hypothetical protein
VKWLDDCVQEKWMLPMRIMRLKGKQLEVTASRPDPHVSAKKSTRSAFTRPDVGSSPTIIVEVSAHAIGQDRRRPHVDW